MREFTARIGLIVASVLLCLVALEITLRLTGYGAVGSREGNVAYYIGPEFEHKAVFNELGLRDREVLPKKPGEFRICVVGDSFTFGLGVEEEQTFVRRTEQLLRHRSDQVGIPMNIRIINCGVGGGPYQQHEWLREVGLKLHPDLVVQAFFIGNDIYDDQNWLRKNVDESAEPLRHPFRTLLKNILILDWLWNHLVSIPIFDRLLFDMGLRYQDRGLFLKDQPEYESHAWPLTLKKLLQIGQDLQSEEISWLVMIIPTSDQVRFGHIERQNENYRLPNEILTEFLSEHQIEYIDLLPLIETQAEKNGFYYRRDLHWTERGHFFAAETLADRLWSLIVDRG